MIQDALIKANHRLSSEPITICSVWGETIFGEHEVIFVNCKDEVVTFKHSVFSRVTFGDGAQYSESGTMRSGERTALFTETTEEERKA